MTKCGIAHRSRRGKVRYSTGRPPRPPLGRPQSDLVPAPASVLPVVASWPPSLPLAGSHRVNVKFFGDFKSIKPRSDRQFDVGKEMTPVLS
ncbi:hypothetical protein J6590_004819 [Homalodisca vitripennis]|nr:hypothetical protein J6590_004819 [Homalodisca vitripennis]